MFVSFLPPDSYMSGVRFPHIPSIWNCNALVIKKLLLVSSLAVSLAINMYDEWVLMLFEKFSDPQSSCENDKPWNKINQHIILATVAFVTVKGVFKIYFQVCFPTPPLQRFVLQVLATNHRPPPKDANGLFYIEPSPPYVWVPVVYTTQAMLYVALKPEAFFDVTMIWLKWFSCAWTSHADIFHIVKINFS